MLLSGLSHYLQHIQLNQQVWKCIVRSIRTDKSNRDLDNRPHSDSNMNEKSKRLAHTQHKQPTNEPLAHPQHIITKRGVHLICNVREHNLKQGPLVDPPAQFVTLINR